MIILKLKTRVSFLAFIVLSSLLISCNTNSSEDTRNSKPNGTLWADTIIYSVVVKNPNAYDDWTEKCLSQLNQSQMVNQLFDAVYNKKATAYNYNTNLPMTISDIKELEKTEGFSRDNVGKLQFWESWYYDADKLEMSKKVHSILIAYELLAEDSTLRGYKAGFYIRLNK